MYDAVLIGAGHNALVCAHDLAAAGWKVLVVERRHLVGGCCVTEELWPGYRINPAAYVVSLLLPENSIVGLVGESGRCAGEKSVVFHSV